MSQWTQFPLQTGFNQQPQFQQPQQQPQFQQQQFTNPQFQQGYALANPQLNPQPTGFPSQRPQGFQQPQQTGFQPASGFLQAQPTGFVGSSFQQQSRPPPPPVPPLPSRLQQPNQSFNFLNAPPTPSLSVNTPSLVSQPTGFAPRVAVPLVPQVTGYIDPRLQLMSSTFMPMNASAPYSAVGMPLLAPQQQNLQQSFQHHNQTQSGAVGQQMSWALSKAEKKNYDQIFRSWDAQSTGFISGQTASEVFGASGISKDELARIWGLADKDNRGKLNIAEFHVAMGLIYRRLNGMMVPEQLPPELIPPSAQDLGNSVDMLKDLLKHETYSRSPSATEAPVSRLKNRSFNSTSPSLESGRDATIYKHDDSEPPGGFYQPRSRHVNRDDVRSRNEQGASADLTEMKRKLANTAEMLDRAAEAEAAKTEEDEELEKEMDDLKYRVERVSEDLQYASRGPRSVAKDEEKRRLEREFMSLMHDRIPELERKIKARDEKREREKRQWTRDRDRANERFGRYDPKDDSYTSRRYDDRDRPHSRGTYDRDDRDDQYGRNYDRREYDRTPSRNSRSREGEREFRPARSTPAPAASALEPPSAVTPPKLSPSPTPAKNLTSEERLAYAKAQALRRIEARKAALGIVSPSTTSLDTSVEERLQQEKREAEEKSLAAEKQAEERERLRRERLENEKAFSREGKSPIPSPVPVVSETLTQLSSAPVPKAPPSRTRAPAPPPPRRNPTASNVKSGPPPPGPSAPIKAPAVGQPMSRTPVPIKAPAVEQPMSRTPVPIKASVVEKPTPTTHEVNPEEEAMQMREETLKKQREARAERLRQLEREEEEAARREEEEYRTRLQALKAKATAQPAQPVHSESPSITSSPLIDTPTPAPATPIQGAPTTSDSMTKSTIPSTSEKSTNPFSRFISKDASSPAAPAPPADNTGNPWARAMSNPIAPSPPKSPFPAAKPSYNIAPSSSIDDDWDEVKENESDEDSSDDEIARSRATRANIAQQLFGSILPTPTSGASAGSTVTSPRSPGPDLPLPPPPPPPPPAPLETPPVLASGPEDVSALMRSIQGGKALRPTKTVDKSGPPVSGRVLGDSAPPLHINASISNVPSSSFTQDLPKPIPMESPNSDNRQSVDWFANRAVDAGLSNSWVDVLPSTREEEQEEKHPIPIIQVEQMNIQNDANDLLSDIDKSTVFRARTLYSFTGDGPDELSFEENVVLVANPSKSGGDWWRGTLVGSGKSGLFPKNFVQVVEPVTAKALYDYSGGSPEELQFSEGEIISIIDKDDEEWWKAERDGVVYIVPATYVEVVG